MQATAMQATPDRSTVFHAYAALKAGEKLRPWEYEPAPLDSREVEIRVTHNGLCHTDLHMRDNDWNVSQFPLVPCLVTRWLEKSWL